MAALSEENKKLIEQLTAKSNQVQAQKAQYEAKAANANAVYAQQKKRQSAQIAPILDNALRNKATATQGTTNPAEMYRPGNVAAVLFNTPNYVSNYTMSGIAGMANNLIALSQDSAEDVQAREAQKKAAEQQKADLEKALNDLYQQMEGYKNNGQTDKVLAAEQEYADINNRIAQTQAEINDISSKEAAVWEAKQHTEIMSTGDGASLMYNLGRLVELADSMAKVAGQWGNNKKKVLAEKEAEYYALYNSLKSKYGEQVDSWLDYKKRMRNKSRMAMSTAMARQAAEDKQFWSSVGAIPLNLASGIGYLDAAGQKLQRKATGSDTPIDYNTPAQAFSKMSNTIRGTVSEDMGGVGKFLYNTGMSMFDTLAAMPMGGFGMALLGGSAATNAMQSAVERGANDEQALKIGFVAGALETALERTSIDRLFSLKDPKIISEFFTNAFKQSGVELTEEGLTNLGNTFADAVIMGDKSELNTAKRAYMANGDSPEKADGKALADWGVNLLLDMAGGALSGFFFGSVKSGFDIVRNGGFQKPTVESVMPKLQPEPQTQPTVADITPIPQQAQEALSPASVAPNLQQTEVIPIADFRQTASEILADGIFDSPTYGEALEQTGMKRSDVRDALRTVARNNISASNSPNVQTVLSAIKGVDAQSVQAQTTPDQMVADVVSRMTGEVQAAPTSETPSAVSSQVKTEAPKIEPDVRIGELDATPAMGAVGDMGAKTSEFPHEVKESRGKTIPKYNEQNNIPEDSRADNLYTARTWAEARNNARTRLEQDYTGEVDELTRKPLWSDEEVFEAETVLNDLRKKAQETGDWSEHQAWSQTFVKHGEEIARALSALRGVGKDTAETILANAAASLENAANGTNTNAVMQEVDKYAVRYEKASETKNVDGLLEIIRDTAATRKTDKRKGGLSKEIDWALNRVAEYARAELAAGKQAGTLEAGKFYDFLQNFAANGIKAIATDKQKISFGQGYRTIQHNFILSKFLTIMRNLVNNGVLDPLDSFAGNLVVPLDAALSKFTKTRSVAFDKSWFSEAKRKGSLDGMAMALLEIGLDVNGDGKAGKYEDVGKRTFHMANGGIAKFLSAWEKYSGYVMGATDEFTKGGVRDEVQRGVDSLYEQNKIKDDTLRNAGEQAALYRTLQDETIPSKIVTGTRRALNHAQIGGLGLGDVTIKFAQVPANLPARAADFSPVGLVRGLGKMAKVLIDAKNRKLTAAQQASAVKDIGRGITGSSLILASTALALKGIIHVVAPGGEDENKDKAASEQAQGLKETQLNLSALLRSIKGEDTSRRDDDKMVSFGFLDPINAHLMTGALIAEDIEEARKAGEKISLGDVLTDSLQGTLHALLDLPLMDPINDIRYAWQKSDGDNEVEKAWDVVKQGVAGEVTSFIPNALKGIAQGIDPYQRDMYSKDDLVGRTVDQIIGSIPIWRQTLPIKQDVYGNDIKNPEQLLNFMNANILPGAITTYTETDLQRVLNDLSEQSGKNSMYLSKDAPKSITEDGEEFKLTKAQQTKFMAERGDIYEAASAALENNETYQNFSIDWKVQAYAEAENYAVQTAKDGLGTKFKPADWVKDLEGASPEELAEAMVQRVVESMAKKAGENKYLGLETLLENKSIDDQMALACMPTSCYDAYTANCEKADISVQQFLDAYGTAYANGTTSAERKQAALDYIAGLDISAKQKGALAQAVHEAIGSFIPQDTQLPDQWLLDIGDTNRIVQQMGTEQRQKYNTYIKGSEVETQTYLDMMEYYRSNAAATKKDANGKPIEGHETRDYMEKYIRNLNVSDAEKGRLYCSLYAEKTCPKDLLVAAFGVETAEQYISDARIEGYEKYVKGSNIDILTYFDLVDYYNSSESDGTKGKDGKVIKGQSKQDKVLAWIAKLNIPNKDKGRLFCSLYSYKNCPRNWR